ncbi:modulator of macroautophagy TMEM150B isoform X1 [Alligator sinensis]|uniref:Modulator of macroautophagy TMEM150B isoform X1 n=1 Tax=Alligator sinensis TaxID=38654 RepID=A0A3Q0G4P7_ALLSI|nr:modulator of macroautophagy TMEM150B isoform X1 [Alligator sinensis]
MLIKPPEGRTPWPRHPGLGDRAWLGQGEAKTQVTLAMLIWALLPVVLAVGAAIGFWVVYAMAVANGSVNITVVFPYISTCGSFPPQSCIFGQVLNLGAFVVVWISVLKYQHVREYGCHSALNTTGLVLGLLCALGASIVGNFQQSNQLETHLVGAFLAFAVGVGYFWVQAILTYRVTPRHGGNWIGPIRIFLCAGSTTFLVAMVTLHMLGLRSVAAGCEWALAMTLFLLFGLFAVEFRHVTGCSLRLQRPMPTHTHELVTASNPTLAL